MSDTAQEMETIPGPPIQTAPDTAVDMPAPPIEPMGGQQKPTNKRTVDYHLDEDDWCCCCKLEPKKPPTHYKRRESCSKGPSAEMSQFFFKFQQTPDTILLVAFVIPEGCVMCWAYTYVLSPVRVLEAIIRLIYHLLYSLFTLLLAGMLCGQINCMNATSEKHCKLSLWYLRDIFCMNLCCVKKYPTQRLQYFILSLPCQCLCVEDLCGPTIRRCCPGPHTYVHQEKVDRRTNFDDDLSDDCKTCRGRSDSTRDYDSTAACDACDGDGCCDGDGDGCDGCDCDDD
jgi:hypothetical protein